MKLHKTRKIPEFKTPQEDIDYWEEQSRKADASGVKWQEHIPKQVKNTIVIMISN